MIGRTLGHYRIVDKIGPDGHSDLVDMMVYGRFQVRNWCRAMNAITQLLRALAIILVLGCVTTTTHASDQGENPAPFQATLVDGSTLDVRDYRVVGQQVYLTLWSGTMLAFNKEEVTIQRRYVRDGQEHLTAVDDVTQHPRITHVPDNLGEYATGLNLHT